MSDDRNLPDTADHIGQAAGGISGVVAGAAIGASAGPVGALLGGIAGAIGGWWCGRALAEAAEDITEAEDQYYRNDFERRAVPRSYDEVRRAYLLGDVAAANPDYRSFEEIEPELSRGWGQTPTAQREWESVKDYASIGFTRGRERRRKPR
jgi:hypothetical protein